MPNEWVTSLTSQISTSDVALCSFSSEGLTGQVLRVVDWQGIEALSRPYRFEIRLTTQNALLDDEAMLLQPATLSITDAEGKPQPYHGFVTDVEQLDSYGDYYFFRVVLEPRMSLLRQFRFSEVWGGTSLNSIIRDVLRFADLIEPCSSDSLTAVTEDSDYYLQLHDDTYVNINFTCQFEETCFTFLSRLLEHYGIYYFFVQGAKKEMLVFCDELRFQPKTETVVNYQPLDRGLEVETQQALARSFKRRSISQSETVILKDFSGASPKLELSADSSVAKASLPTGVGATKAIVTKPFKAYFGEYGLYGEHFGGVAQGEWLAKRRAQALGCRTREFHGNGRATGLRAGYLMRLAMHPRAHLNDVYQVIEVQHEGSQPVPGLEHSYNDGHRRSDTRFVALPAGVQYRPACDTPKPNIRGVFSAVIEGDDSGNPLLNENGCYRVRFPFVRSRADATHGSAFLRMASLSSGAHHGLNFPLLNGAEVLVAFLGGDPDRPVITGTVANAENPNPVTKKNFTQRGFSSPGGNYLVADDNALGTKFTMGSPIAESRLALGLGAFQGAHLSTKAHMEFASDTYSHYVGDVYRSSIGRTADAKVSGIVVDAKIRDDNFDAFGGRKIPALDDFLGTWKTWANPSVAGAGQSDETYSAQLNTAKTQRTVSTGTDKQDYTNHKTVLNYNQGGIKADVNEGNAYRFDRHRMEASQAHRIKSTSFALDTVITTIDTTLFNVVTDTGGMTGINSLTVRGNDHTITLDSRGIVIKTSKSYPIVLDGHVVIAGSLLVKETVLVEKEMNVKTSILSNSMATKSMSCDELNAAKTNEGAALKIVPVDTQSKKFEVDSANKYKEQRSDRTKNLNKLAALNGGVLKVQSAYLQSKAGALKSPVALSSSLEDKLYAAQELLKSVLHTAQGVKDVYDAAMALLADTVPDASISGPIVKRMEGGFAKDLGGVMLAGAAAGFAAFNTGKAVVSAATSVAAAAGPGIKTVVDGATALSKGQLPK